MRVTTRWLLGHCGAEGFEKDAPRTAIIAGGTAQGLPFVGCHSAVPGGGGVAGGCNGAVGGR